MLSSIRPFLADSTLKPKPPKPPPEPPKDLNFSYNSQDHTVMTSQPYLVAGVQPGPQVEKARLDERLEPVDGQYVYGECDPRHTAALSFAATAKTIEVFSAALGHPISWAFSDARLTVTPDDGVDFNAYYSRGSAGIHFFHGTDPVTKGNVMSGASGEVVSHETGHAMLDGLRPGYLGTWSTDPGAFHESFGDMVGILMSLQDDRVIGRVAVETGGDLSKNNMIANTGEELGKAINDKSGSNRTGGDYVRTAINKFTWADPSTLPDRGGPDQLGSEVHSFSRLWTGAFYDVLKGINQEYLQGGMEAKQALRETGNEGLKLLANLMKKAPQGDFTYNDMAKAFVASDRKYNDGKRADLIEKVYADRLILQKTEPAPTAVVNTARFEHVKGANSGIYTSTEGGRVALSDVTRTVRVKLSGDEYGMFSGATVDTVVDSDGSLSKDAEAVERTRRSLQQHISAGRIKYTEPGARLGEKDLFDKNGQPYVGVVRWEGDQMSIERVKIAS